MNPTLTEAELTNLKKAVKDKKKKYQQDNLKRIYG